MPSRDHGQRKIVSNSSLMLVNVAITGATVLANVVLIGRVLGKEAFGVFSVLMAVASIMQLFADGGIVRIAIRDISRNGDDVRNIVVQSRNAVLLFSLLLLPMVVLVISAGIVDHSMALPLIIMITASLVAVNGLVYSSVMQARQELKAFAVISVLHKVLLLSLLAGVLWRGHGIVAVTVVHLVANFVQTFLLRALALRITGSLPRKLFVKESITRWKEALGLGLAMVLRKMTVHVQTLLLAAFVSVAAVGLYNAVFRIVQMVELAMLSLTAVLFPVISRLYVEHPQRITGLLSVAYRAFMVLTIPFSAALLYGGRELLPLVFGSEFVDSGHVTQVLGVSLLFLVPATLLMSVVTAANRQNQLLMVSGVVAAVNLGLGLALVPAIGVNGASIASAASELSGLLICFFVVRRSNIRVDFLFDTVKLGALLLALGVPFLPALNLAFWPALVLAMLMYVPLLFVLQIVSVKDLRALKQQAPLQPVPAK